MKHNALKAAFPYTIPVLLGYIFLGIAFGILLSSQGYPYWLAILMSLCIYAGSMQFVAINLFNRRGRPFECCSYDPDGQCQTPVLRSFHAGKFRTMKHKKPYMIFSLTDENLFPAVRPDTPPQVWIQTGFTFYCPAQSGLLGHRLRRRSPGGSLITFNSTGIDFAMTALFIVIFVEQWRKYKNHLPAVIGVTVTIFCRIISEPIILLFFHGRYCHTPVRKKSAKGGNRKC